MKTPSNIKQFKILPAYIFRLGLLKALVLIANTILLLDKVGSYTYSFELMPERY
jgi:hypothetical protein